MVTYIVGKFAMNTVFTLFNEIVICLSNSISLSSDESVCMLRKVSFGNPNPDC